MAQFKYKKAGHGKCDLEALTDAYTPIIFLWCRTNLERLNFDSLKSLVRLTCQEEVKTNCVRHHGGEQR